MALPYQGKDEARRQGKVWILETCQLNRRYHHTQIQKLVSSSGALPFKKNPLPHLFYSHRSCFRGQSPGMGKLCVLGEDPKQSYIQGQGTDCPALTGRRASL